MNEPIDLLLKNARIATCCNGSLGVLDNGSIGIREGRICWVSQDTPTAATVSAVVDIGGRLVLPGLVDPHTHLVFAGSRVDEFARKMAGVDYRTIAAEGGGIASTVRATRNASDAELLTLTQRRARMMLEHGVTTIEIKSGYGLTTRDELRCLQIAKKIEGSVVTFLGAHTVPPERRDDRDSYIGEIVEGMLPAVAEEALADACDVYIDEGAFRIDEAERILRAAKSWGLRVKAHVGQFSDLGGAELLAELGGLSVDHVENVSDTGLRALAAARVRAVLLPGAWTTLRQTPPDAARLRTNGLRIAIGTDCNPGTSPCTDLLLCAALAVRDAGLTIEEAILGITYEAAEALGLHDVGRIEEGARADLAVFEVDSPHSLAYALGDSRATRVYRDGKLVHDHSSHPLHAW